MRYYQLPPLPPRFTRYYRVYQEQPRASKIGYIVFLIIGIFIGKSGYDWTKVQEAIKMDQELKTKVEQSLSQGQYDRVIQYSNEALQLKLKTWWKDYGMAEKDYFNLANAYKAKGELDRAIEYANKSLSIAVAKYGDTNEFTQAVKTLLTSLNSVKNF